MYIIKHRAKKVFKNDDCVSVNKFKKHIAHIARNYDMSVVGVEIRVIKTFIRCLTHKQYARYYDIHKFNRYYDHYYSNYYVQRPKTFIVKHGRYVNRFLKKISLQFNGIGLSVYLFEKYLDFMYPEEPYDISDSRRYKNKLISKIETIIKMPSDSRIKQRSNIRISYTYMGEIHYEPPWIFSKLYTKVRQKNYDISAAEVTKRVDYEYVKLLQKKIRKLKSLKK